MNTFICEFSKFVFRADCVSGTILDTGVTVESKTTIRSLQAGEGNFPCWVCVCVGLLLGGREDVKSWMNRYPHPCLKEKHSRLREQQVRRPLLASSGQEGRTRKEGREVLALHIPIGYSRAWAFSLSEVSPWRLLSRGEVT